MDCLISGALPRTAYIHVWQACVTFSLLPGVEGWLRFLLVALPGLVFTFLHTSVILVNLICIKLEKTLKKYVIFLLIYNKDSKKKKRKCFSSSTKFITNIKKINAVVHELFSVLADWFLYLPDKPVLKQTTS